MTRARPRPAKPSRPGADRPARPSDPVPAECKAGWPSQADRTGGAGPIDQARRAGSAAQPDSGPSNDPAGQADRAGQPARAPAPPKAIPAGGQGAPPATAPARVAARPGAEPRGAATDGLELVALPHGADLDLVAAARCLLLLRPRARLVRPSRLASNAWSLVRRAPWYPTGPLDPALWEQARVIHLLGLTQAPQSPELVGRLPRLAAEVICYAHAPPTLPVVARSVLVKACSYTAHFVNELRRQAGSLSDEDAALLTTAVTERTWCGLAHRVTPLDLDALQYLRTFPVPAKQVGNLVCLGLREGQRGLLNDLLSQATDETVGHWPVMVTVARTIGNVQDLLPVMDALWSRLDAFVLVAAVSYGSRSRVFTRSRLVEAPLGPCFRAWNPLESERWLTFQVPHGEPAAVRDLLLDALRAGLRPDTTAREIMAVSPRSIPASETVENAHDMMLRFNLMSLVVTRDDRYVGLITRRDIDRAIQMDLWGAPIESFVPRTTPEVRPDMPVRVLRQLMLRHNVTRLPVVEDGVCVGLITARELLRAMRDPLPLPREFLPLVQTTDLPTPAAIEGLLRRVMPERVLPLLKKIGAKAAALGRQAFLVGGFVRDLLLERACLDLDIVLIGDALPFVEAVQTELGAELCHFEQFRTARLAVDGLKIDFSSARIEHYEQPAALPEVELSGLSNDLFRRDFTINALALDILPERFLHLRDFFGGYRDLCDRQIRILHSFSFLEDPTRLFRALRFASRFRFTLEADTQRAFDLAVQRGAVTKLSPKRIGAEIGRCLLEEAPHRVLRRLFETGLIRALHPDLRGYEQLPVRFRLVPGMVRRFAALGEPIDLETIHWTGLLMPLSLGDADRILRDLHFPARRRHLVMEALRLMPHLPGRLARLAPDDDVGLHSLLQGLALETLISLIAFCLDKGGARRVLDFLGRLRGIRCELTGKDLLAMGIPPGPHMRTILADLLARRIRGELTSRKDEETHVRQTAHLHLPPSGSQRPAS